MKDCERGIGALTGAIFLSLKSTRFRSGVRGRHWAQTVQRSMWIPTGDGAGQMVGNTAIASLKGFADWLATKRDPTGVEPLDCQGNLRQFVSGFLKSKFNNSLFLREIIPLVL